MRRILPILLIITIPTYLALAGCSKGGETGLSQEAIEIIAGSEPAEDGAEGDGEPQAAAPEDVGDTDATPPTEPAEGGEPAPEPAEPMPDTVKLCQVIGEYDRQTKEYTSNRTASAYNLYGTDLGFSFPSGDRIYFLFGDCWAGRDENAFTFFNRDAIAYADAATLGDSGCIDLTFEAKPPNPDDLVEFRPIDITGGDVEFAGFEVPVGGFDNEGTMYLLFATESKYFSVSPLPGQRITPTRTVMAKRAAPEDNFTYLYDLSTYTHVAGTYYPDLPPGFINATPVIVDSSQVPGLPKEGKGVLIYGAGFYRQSKVYLAYIAMEDIEAREPIDGMTDRYRPTGAYFFAGLDDDQKPIWRDDWENHTSDAVPLFDMLSPEDEPIHDVGELSVVLDPLTQRFYMAYQSMYDRGVHLRYARKTAPWTFSESRKIYLPEQGYGVFIHSALLEDGLNDPGRLNWGGAYGPYMIPQLFTYDFVDNTEDIYFLLSTWNPYTVVLMRTTITVD